jgi:uncharacterized protein (DUF924 family)
MTEANMKQHVSEFRNVWFPESGEVQKFWFRARNPKFSTIMTALCEKHAHAVSEWLKSYTPSALIKYAEKQNLSNEEFVILAIMLDQMPRNALAIGFGEYQGKDAFDVSSNISNEFSLQFARMVFDKIHEASISDHHVLCFLSLIFRHSNQFAEARAILEKARMNDGSLPPLAERFLTETSKRENLVS